MLLSLLLYQDEEISASVKKKNIVKSLFFVIKQSY